MNYLKTEIFGLLIVQVLVIFGVSFSYFLGYKQGKGY